MGKASKIAKAKKTTKALKQPTSESTHRVRTKLRFYRPKTRKTPSAPRTLKSLSSEIRKIANRDLDFTQILVQPVASDKNILKMENSNTITFIVHPNAKKSQIKHAFQKLYNVKVRKVNTLNTPRNKKKAYIMLENKNDALNIASKIGIL